MALASLLSLAAAAAVPLAQTCFRAEPSELDGSTTDRRERMQRISRLIRAVVESDKRLILILRTSSAIEIFLAKLNLYIVVQMQRFTMLLTSAVVAA